jgi:hypothetical protein
MANTPDYSWPPMDARKCHRQADQSGWTDRRKAAGRAKYSSDKSSPA